MESKELNLKEMKREEKPKHHISLEKDLLYFSRTTQITQSPNPMGKPLPWYILA
jgi:hypothetical protein